MFGRFAGMDDDYVLAVERMDKTKLDPREYTALCWVDELLSSEAGVSKETEELFMETFSEVERLRILAAMRAMFCVNVSLNTYEVLMCRMLGIPERKRIAACRI